MKLRGWLLLMVGAASWAPQFAAAQGNFYLGLAMFNPSYDDDSGNHRSTGLLARAGYKLTPHLALEAQGGGSIGGQTASAPDEIRAQMSSLYAGFVRVATPFKYGSVYALGGIAYGTRVLRYPGGASFTDQDSNKAFGVGMEVSDDGALGLSLEWMRYFDNQYYTLDAWNLGLVTHF